MLVGSLPILKNRGISTHKPTDRDMPDSVRRFHIDKQTVAFILTLGLLAVGGIWLLAYSTPFGLGLNDDSIAYSYNFV